MKTPDEIKKGLEDGVPYHVHKGEAYLGYIALAGTQHKMSDALAYIQQLERERDAAVECIGKLMVILKKYPYAATNGCAYQAYCEIQKYVENMRGVKEE